MKTTGMVTGEIPVRENSRLLMKHLKFSFAVDGSALWGVDKAGSSTAA